MTKNQKIFLLIIAIATVVVLIIGSTFAFWTWTSNSSEATGVTFTVGTGYTCSADGGGNITSSNIMLAPADCTNSNYAIKRTVKVSTTQSSGKTIYLDMNLKVNSIGSGLAASKNFKYALTTSSTHCESGILAEGNFVGVQANDELPLLTNERYIQTTANDTLYLWIWLDKEETSSSTQNQTFNLSLTGSCTDEEPAAMVSPWGETADLYTRINFANISSASNGQGLYVFKPTINDTNPIYYYRGAVSNNNVFFGGYCWKIVRTTETGGVKLIYNGDDDGSGHCTNTTGTATQIGTSAFNSNYTSPADVGYMYGTRYTYSSKSSTQLSTSYKYGNSFRYDGTNYNLVDTIDTSGTWVTDYNTLNNNHYTCFNTTGVCTSIYYVYYTSSSNAYYITLTNGKSVEQAIDEMLTNNTNSSTIKSAIDTWYTTNLSSEEANLEDTVWCNDREISELNGWNPNGGSTYGSSSWTDYSLIFKPYERAYTLYYPKLTCTRSNDSFTKSSTNGNGELSNPIGLITSDEVMLAGGKADTVNSTYYLNTNQSYWLGSPYCFDDYVAYEFRVYSAGYLSYNYVSDTFGVRPAVSLKPGATWSGSGTSTEPYTVSYS